MIYFETLRNKNVRSPLFIFPSLNEVNILEEEM